MQLLKRHFPMPIFHIYYDPRETLPDRIKEKAAELNVTPEMLIKRFIDAGMEGENPKPNPEVQVTDLDSLFVNLGLMRPKA